MGLMRAPLIHLSYITGIGWPPGYRTPFSRVRAGCIAIAISLNVEIGVEPIMEDYVWLLLPGRSCHEPGTWPLGFTPIRVGFVHTAVYQLQHSTKWWTRSESNRPQQRCKPRSPSWYMRAHCLVVTVGIEPTTRTLSRCRSSTELRD